MGTGHDEGVPFSAKSTRAVGQVLLAFPRKQSLRFCVVSKAKDAARNKCFKLRVIARLDRAIQ